MYLLHAWVINGIPFSSQCILSVIVILSVAIPLFLNKSFYCDYLCPYGAAQELAGKLNKNKIPIPLRNAFIIKHLRKILFFILMLTVLLIVNIDLTNFEPFSAFIFVSASVAAISLALIFLVLSIFFNKPWCHYFCPTGQFLDFFRIRRK